MSLADLHSQASADAAALILVRGPATAADEAALAAADAAGWLAFDVELTDGAAGPWDPGALPGQAGGCAVRPGRSARQVHIRSDAGGLFLVARLDLLLRSNGVTCLYQSGEAPEELLDALRQFARLRGYQFVPLGRAQPAARPHARAGEQAILPDFASRVSPPHAALVLIDVQNDFCAAAGATGRTGRPMTMIDGAVDRIKGLLRAARAAGLFVVHVRAEYGELYRSVGSPYRFPAKGGPEPAVWTASAADLAEGERFPEGMVEVCLSGSWGGQFVDGIEPLPHEAVVTKHRFSAFADTGLDLLLRANGISSVILAGVTTNCCVETSAREAVMRDFHLVVAADCVAVKDHLRDLHDATLTSLGLYFGLVRPSADIIAQWSKLGDERPPAPTA